MLTTQLGSSHYVASFLEATRYADRTTHGISYPDKEHED